MNSPTKKLLHLPFAALAFGLMVVGHANAGLMVCNDAAGNTGSGGANASSAIDTLSGGPTLNTGNCGPWPGNDSNGGLTADMGGYGYDLSGDGGLDGGWVLYDKYDVGGGYTNATGDLDVTITAGTDQTQGTFSFVDTSGSDNSFLFVLKFDGVFASYLSATDTGGAYWGWDTDYDNDGKFVNSHLSVYYRDSFTPPQEVPVPSTLALLGLPLLGLGWLRRRRC